MYCDRCGTAIEERAESCPACGASQAVAVVGSSAISPPVLAAGGAPATVLGGPGDWLSQGWNAVTANFWVFVLLAAIFLLGSSTVPILLQGPLTMGLQWAALRQVLGRRADLNDLGAGFNLIGPSLLICLLTTLIFSVAGAFFLIPALFAAALLQFPYLLVLDRGLPFGEAIKQSFEVSQYHLGKLIGFVLLQICLLVAGALLCGIGILVAIPILFAATAAAYVDLFGVRSSTKAAMG
jgi:uncharacterized membrane protein